MSEEKWVPLFEKADTTSTSTPLSESRRSSSQGTKFSPSSVYINRTLSENYVTYGAGAFEGNSTSDDYDYAGSNPRTPKLSPTISREWAGATLMQRGASTGVDGSNGISTSTKPQYSTSHTRKRSITSKTTPLLGAPPGSSTGMERIPSLTSFMAPKEGKNRISPTSAKSHRRLLGPVFLFRAGLLFFVIITFIQIGKWGFLGSTAENYITKRPIALVETFDSEGSPILAPLHIPSWYDRLVAQSLTASFPKHETFAYPISTHPRTPRQHDNISLADYLTTRLGSHFSTPSSGIPTHLWLTTATKTSILVSTRHLEAFIASLDHKAAKANEQAIVAAEAESAIDGNPTHRPTIVIDNLAARSALVVMCMDVGCMKICSEKGWYCFGGFKEDVEEVKGVTFDAIRETVKLHGIIGTLESGRRVFVVDSDVYFRDDPVPYLGLLDEYDIQLPDSWSTNNIHAGFIYLNPTKNVISLWRKIHELQTHKSSIDPELIFPNLLLDPKGVPRKHQKTPVSASTISDGVILDDVYFDEAVEGGYGQSQFQSAWGGGMDVKVLDRKRFRSSTGRDGGSFGGVMNSPAIYLHCACCEDLKTTDYIAGTLGYHQPYASFPASAITGHHDAIPKFPMILTLDSLIGTPKQIAFIMGLLLQACDDTKRSLLPPMKGTILTKDSNKNEIVRYIWSLFPMAHWAGKEGNFETSAPRLEHQKVNVAILNPGYISHSTNHLKEAYPNSQASNFAISELKDTLYLDVASINSYAQLVKTLSQPYFSTTLVVTLENSQSMMDLWKLKPEYTNLELCYEALLEGEGETGVKKCGKLCSRSPEMEALLLNSTQ